MYDKFETLAMKSSLCVAILGAVRSVESNSGKRLRPGAVGRGSCGGRTSGPAFTANLSRHARPAHQDSGAGS